MRPTYPIVLSVLTSLSLTVGGVTFWVEANKPTAKKIAAFSLTHSLENSTPEKRKEIVEAIAAKVNGLEENERYELRERKQLEPFWLAMTTEERSHYLELILPTDFKRMIENFNTMHPIKRREMVEKAVQDLRARGGEKMPVELTPAQQRKIVNEGLRAYFSEATIEAKMDALPFIEELEKSIQWNR